jgi:prepilin-type N-terminal cleavage/methylation domain-containing protein
MENEKKSTLKGFTLVELLVVMAIFSVLMSAALALTTPVSRMYKNTSLAERTYSYSHNIQEYIQGTLEYSDNLVIYTSDKLGAYATNLEALAEKYRADHYHNLVTTDNGTTTRDIVGKIYIMRLLNKPEGTHPAGQILLYEYPFEHNAIRRDYVKVTEALNPAYFDPANAKYSFSYALGDSRLVTVPTPSGADSGDSYKALSKDRRNLDLGLTVKNLSLSIVLDKESGNQGYYDITDPAGDYRAFKAPVAVQIANLPLTNINSRGGTAPKGIPRIRRDVDGSAVLRLQRDDSPNECGEAFEINANEKVDFSNDIYFVFSYADELR